MTDEEWQNLYENFDTYLLLDAVDHIDSLRVHLGDGEFYEPPEIRTNMLKLHGLAMNVVNNGWDGDLKELAELADDLAMQTSSMMVSLEKLHQILSRLNRLLPDSAYGIDLED